jgi:hypothetical protein
VLCFEIFMSQQPNSDLDRRIFEVSVSHTHIQQDSSERAISSLQGPLRAQHTAKTIHEQPFEHAIPPLKRLQLYALYRTATGADRILNYLH